MDAWGFEEYRTAPGGNPVDSQTLATTSFTSFNSNFTMPAPSTDYHASTGINPFSPQGKYNTYKSKFGPKYQVPLNYHGWTIQKATRLGMTLSAFGGVAGFFALYFFSDVPKVRKDIWQKVPVVGDHFVKEIHPSDNPFWLSTWPMEMSGSY